MKDENKPIKKLREMYYKYFNSEVICFVECATRNKAKISLMF